VIELISHLLEAVVLGSGLIGLAVAGVWMNREDHGPDVEMERAARRRDGGAL
jgi:hypothetical protein